MNIFQVELKKTTYITLSIEATSKEMAEEMALEEVEGDEQYYGDASWEVESIETDATDETRSYGPQGESK